MGSRPAESPAPSPPLSADSTNATRLQATIDFSHSSPTSNSFAVGSLLGPYRIQAKLGEGGMGAVYKAVHEHLDKVVAIKVLSSAVTDKADSVARFKREMKSVGKLNHPNIVQAHDAGEVAGTHYLAMEYIDGTDLLQHVKQRGPMSVVNACKAIRQSAQALAAAHAAGLVHRDIKPSNLLVAKNGQIKVLDLGLARLMGDTAAPADDLTTAGQTFGTPDYMAPEQWEDARSVDARTDLYALGCTLYFLLTGRAPYGGEAYRTVANKMKGHVLDPIPELSPSGGNLPPEVVAIYRKLMAKRPEERFQTAAELAEALAPFSTSKSTASPAASPTPVPTLPELPVAETSPRPSRPVLATVGSGGTRPPRRLLLAAGGAAAALLLGVIIITITNRDGTKSTIKVPEGVETDVEAAPGSKVKITQSGGSSASQPSTINPQPTGWHGWPADAPKPAIAPFDAAQAKRHQEEWAAYLKIPVEYTNSIGMKFRLIPPGEFTMGSTAEEIAAALKDAGENKHWQECIKSEAPQHQVILTQPIYLGVKEVMQAGYEKVMGVNPSYFAPMGMGKEAVAGPETANHPVELVSWNDAAEFCSKLSQQENLKPFYFRAGETITPLDGTGYRLPREAEWEFACRAGTTMKYWIGDKDEDLVRAGWFGGNSGGLTHAAGELKANPFGLADIHGNVWEWVQDGWDVSYYGQFSEKPATNPSSLFSAGSQRVIRGGNWDDTASCCRSSGRYANDPTVRDIYLGFRVSLTVDAVRQAIKTPVSQKSPDRSQSAVGWHGWPADAPKPAIAPFDAEQAKQLQEAWAKHLGTDVVVTNSVGMKMTLIPPGEFLMGAPDSDREAQPTEKPQHVVRLTRPFSIGATEVTVGQFRKFVEATKYVTEAESDGKGAFEISPRVRRPYAAWSYQAPTNASEDNPVRCVSWQDAHSFCQWLSDTEGRKYRLPSEAEWEFACRAGTQTRYSFGNSVAETDSPPQGDGAPLTRVAQLAANPFGLYDMHGSVNEICWDSGRTFAAEAITDPLGSLDPKTPAVVRGGAVSSHVVRMRSSHRYLNDPRQFPELNFATTVKGFRVVDTLAP